MRFFLTMGPLMLTPYSNFVLELDAALLGVVDHEVVEFEPVNDDLGVFREVQVLEYLVVVIGVRAVERDVVPPGPLDARFFRGRRADHLEDIRVHAVEPGVADLVPFPAFIDRDIVSVFGERRAAHHGGVARSRNNDFLTHVILSLVQSVRSSSERAARRGSRRVHTSSSSRSDPRWAAPWHRACRCPHSRYPSAPRGTRRSGGSRPCQG